MKTLKEISIENLNNCVIRLAENRRLLTIAEVTEDKNSILKLKFQQRNLEQEIEYHRTKVNN